MNTEEIVLQHLKGATDNMKKALEGAVAEALRRERTELVAMLKAAGTDARREAQEEKNRSKSCELHGRADAYFKMINTIEARKLGRGN
jgi:hypothetical protein